MSGCASTLLLLMPIQLSVSASCPERRIRARGSRTCYISGFSLTSAPAVCIRAQSTPRRLCTHLLQLRHPLAVDHHADDQHLYHHLRQTPVACLSKSVAFLLLGKLALDGRTLAAAIRIGTPHHLPPVALHAITKPQPLDRDVPVAIE